MGTARVDFVQLGEISKRHSSKAEQLAVTPSFETPYQVASAT
jgi:hypothetical protein